MQRHLVDDKRWISQRRFLHALNYCMVLPGPEAQQLATYVGWLLNGVRGGLVAGVLFVIPGVLALLALSAVYVGFGDTTAVSALFAGLAPAVVAVWRVGSGALRHGALWAVAVAAFVALAAFGVPFPLVVAAAAGVGWVLHRLAPSVVHAAQHAAAGEGPAPVISDDALHQEPPSRRRALRVLGVGLALWTVPVVVVALLTGVGSVFTQQGRIANLALYFVVHTLFADSSVARWGPIRLELPELVTVRPVAAAIAVAAAVMVFALRWSMLRTLAVCAALGLAAGLAGLPVA